MTKWVKCSNFMPPPDTDVLLLIDSGGMCVGSLGLNDKKYFTTMDYHVSQSRITHWSFLPEAPKDE